MPQIDFACSHCGQHFEAPIEMAGTQIECPSCHSPTSVPEPVRLPIAPPASVRPAVRQTVPPPVPPHARPNTVIPGTSVVLPFRLDARLVAIVVGLVLLLVAGKGIRYWFDNVYWTTTRSTMTSTNYGSAPYLCVTCQVGADRFLWTGMHRTRYRSGTLEIYAEYADKTPTVVYQGVANYKAQTYGSVGNSNIKGFPYREEVNLAEFARLKRERAEAARIENDKSLRRRAAAGDIVAQMVLEYDSP